MKTLIISNEAMDVFMKIVNSLEDFGLLKKSVSETIIKKKSKEQNCWFHSMLLATLVSTLLGNLMTGLLVKAEIAGRKVTFWREGEALLF